MKKVIIFCQAPADIPYVLTLYEKFNETREVHVFVINVENNYKFLKGLKLNLTALIFIPYPRFRLTNIINLIKERKRIKNLKAEYFNSLEGNLVYFFSIYEDWLSAAFIKGLENNNEVFYIDYYDTFGNSVYDRKFPTLKLLSIKLFYRILTGIAFKVSIVEKLPEFPISKRIQKITLELNNDVYSKYGYKMSLANNKPVALLLLTPYPEDLFEESDYNETQTSILKSLKEAGWQIIVKGHPRLGAPDVSEWADLEISSHVPSEFIDASRINLCLGIHTGALVFFAKSTPVLTYSLIDLFNFIQPEVAVQAKNYLTTFSNNTVSYFSNLGNFKELIYDRNLWSQIKS